MSELLQAVHTFKIAIAKYTDGDPTESIVEIKMKPHAFDIMKHVLARELSENRDFFGTNLHDYENVNKRLEILGIKFVRASNPHVLD